MSKEITDTVQQTNASIDKLQQEIPTGMKYFSHLSSLATEAGVLDIKTKLLIILSLAIQTRSTDCLHYHLKQAVKHGITREEMQELITISVYMGGGPGLMAAEKALEIYEQLYSSQENN